MYSLVALVRLQCRKELHYKLKKFQKKNHDFGRKIAVMKYVPKDMHNFQVSNIVSHYKFNDSHVPFHVENDFLQSHLEVDNTNLFHQEEISENYYDGLPINQQPYQINNPAFYFEFRNILRQDGIFLQDDGNNDDEDDYLDDDDETMEEHESA
jgi:hypothetical protein